MVGPCAIAWSVAPPAAKARRPAPRSRSRAGSGRHGDRRGHRLAVAAARGRVLAEQGDEQERREPHDVEVEPVDRDQLGRDQDRRAERRDLQGVAAPRHERDQHAERRSPPPSGPTAAGRGPGFWPQMLNGDSRSNWNPIVWSQNTRQPPSAGTNGTTVSRPTSANTMPNEIHERSARAFAAAGREQRRERQRRELRRARERDHRSARGRARTARAARRRRASRSACRCCSSSAGTACTGSSPSRRRAPSPSSRPSRPRRSRMPEQEQPEHGERVERRASAARAAGSS